MGSPRSKKSLVSKIIRIRLLSFLGCLLFVYLCWSLERAKEMLSQLEDGASRTPNLPGAHHPLARTKFKRPSIKSSKSHTQELLLNPKNNLTSVPIAAEIEKTASLNTSLTTLLKPIQVLEQYKAWHSVESLKQEPHGRSFAVAYYSCPLQAGNRLHHYFNSFLWAILTNRTLLWDYWDRQNCYKYSGPYDKGICASANTAKDCDKILERLPWLPSFQEWGPKLHLDKEPYQVPIWATHIPSNKGKSARAAAFQPGDEKYTGVDVWLQNETFYSRVVAFPQVVAKSRVLESERHRKYLLHSERARALAIDLHSEGIDFLFGMLFRGSFRFADTLLQETLASSGQLPDSAFSMALHSRHSDKQDHGCDIARERACLEQVFAQMSDANTTWQSCHLFVMADRICTLQQVSEYVQTNASFCRVETAQHSKAGRSWRWEHGPFAGIGYYEDWILASRARQGFIGTRRSSSDLIKEIIEFDRRMEAVSKSTGDVPPLIKCTL